MSSQPNRIQIPSAKLCSIIEEITLNHLQNINYDLLLEDYLTEVATLSDIHKQYYSDIDDETFNYIVALDPTLKPNKMGKYGKWLLSLWRKGMFTPQNFMKTKKYLETYNKFINVIQQKDINQIRSVEELGEIVKPYIDNPNMQTSKTQANKETKLKGAINAYEDDRWVVIVPITKEASMLYGKGTKWCTAAKKDNQFEFYNASGNLYIIIDKQTGRKYQWHLKTHELRDEKNDSVRFIEDTTEGLRDFMGNKISEVDKKITMKKNLLMNKSFEQRMSKGEAPEDIFDFVDEEHEGYYLIRNLNKWNFLSKDNKILSTAWFDLVDYFEKGLAIVEIDGKWNYIRKDCSFLLKDWANLVSRFHEDLGRVYYRENGFNFVDRNGDFVFDDWFYDATDFYNGASYVKDNRDSRIYMITKNGMKKHNQINSINEVGIREIVSEALKQYLSEDVYADLRKSNKATKTIDLSYIHGRPSLYKGKNISCNRKAIYVGCKKS